jgi:hypothetical protein
MFVLRRGSDAYEPNIKVIVVISYTMFFFLVHKFVILIVIVLLEVSCEYIE